MLLCEIKLLNILDLSAKKFLDVFSPTVPLQ